MTNFRDTLNFNVDEIKKMLTIVSSICSAGLSGKQPKLVIFTGGVGAGKTTIRKQKYQKDYVHFDPADIWAIVKKEFDIDDPKVESYSFAVCDLVIKDCLENKRNMVIELIGDHKEPLTMIIDKMVTKGYSVDLQHIECDPAEAYKRHLRAVDEDEDYLSAYFTQDITISFFNQYLNE